MNKPHPIDLSGEGPKRPTVNRRPPTPVASPTPAPPVTSPSPPVVSPSPSPGNHVPIRPKPYEPPITPINPGRPRIEPPSPTQPTPTGTGIGGPPPPAQFQSPRNAPGNALRGTSLAVIVAVDNATNPRYATIAVNNKYPYEAGYLLPMGCGPFAAGGTSGFYYFYNNSSGVGGSIVHVDLDARTVLNFTGDSSSSSPTPFFKAITDHKHNGNLNPDGYTNPANVDLSAGESVHNLPYGQNTLAIQNVINASGNILSTLFPGAQLQSDGSITNVDGATSYAAYTITAGQNFQGSADIAKGVATSNAWFILGNTTNGYGVQFYNGGCDLYRFVGGVTTAIGSAPITLTTDTNYHSFRLTVQCVAANNNNVEASVDGNYFYANDTSLNLTSGTWPITVITAGSAGKLIHYSASVATTHYYTTFHSIRSVIDTSGNILSTEFPNGQLQSDGSITNINGASSHTQYTLVAGQPFSVSVDIAASDPPGSTSCSVILGNLTNGYRLYLDGSNNVQLLSYAGGVGTGLKSQGSVTFDNNYHTYRLTITPGSPNKIEASVDGVVISEITDSAVTLTTGTWPVMLDTGGTSGKVQHYTASATPQHYGTLPSPVQSVVNTSGNMTRCLLQNTLGVDASGFMLIPNGASCQSSSVYYGGASADNQIIYTWRFRTTGNIGTSTSQWLKFIIGSQSQSNPFTQCYTVELNPNGSGTSVACYRWVNGVNNGTQGSGSLGSAATTALGILTDNLVHTCEIVYNYASGTPTISVYIEGIELVTFTDTLGNTGYTGSGSLPGNLAQGYVGIYNGLANSVNASTHLDIRTASLSYHSNHSTIRGVVLSSGALNVNPTPGVSGNLPYSNHSPSITGSVMAKNLVVNGNNCGGSGASSPASYGWTNPFGSATGITSSGTYISSNYNMLHVASSSNGGYFQDIPVISGQTYTFQGVVYNGASGSNPGIWIGSADGAYTQYNNTPGVPSSSGWPTFYQSVNNNVNGWYSPNLNVYDFLYGTFVVPSGVSKIRVILYNSASGVAGSSYFAGVMVTQGSRLQDYIDHELNPGGVSLPIHVSGTLPYSNHGTVVTTNWDSGGNLKNSTGLNNQGSIINVGGVPSSLPYTSSTTTVTLNIPSATISRSDNSTQSVSAYNPQFTGLTASTTYFVLVGVQQSTSTYVAYLSGAAFSGAQIIQYIAGDGLIPIYVNTTVGTTASGSGGGSVSGGSKGCPAIWQLVETLENGFIRADCLEIGQHLRGPNGWVKIEDMIIRQAPLYSYTIRSGNISETISVNENHKVLSKEGKWLRVCDLLEGTNLSGDVLVEQVECIGLGEYVGLEVEGHQFMLGKSIVHNGLSY